MEQYEIWRPCTIITEIPIKLEEAVRESSDRKAHFKDRATFQGKVDLLKSKKGFHPGLNPTLRDKYARGIVANYINKHE